MPAKRTQTSVDHEVFTVLALTLVTLLTFASSDIFFSSSAEQSIAHANTSANPYQPVTTDPTGIPLPYGSGYMPSYQATGVISSSVRSLPPAVIKRKLKTARRSLVTLQNRIEALQDVIDGLQKKVDASPGRTSEELEAQLLARTDELFALEEKFAKINSQIAAFELQLDPTKDASR